MFCMECGAKITEEAKFCQKCGSQLELIATQSHGKSNSSERPKKLVEWYKKPVAWVVGIGSLMALIFGGPLYFARQSDIVGTWTCSDTNPNGSVTTGKFKFAKDGTFVSDGEAHMSGTYERSGSKVAMRVKSVSQGSTTLAADAAMDLTITKINATQLAFDSVVARSGNKRSSACNRDEVKQEHAQAPTSENSQRREQPNTAPVPKPAQAPTQNTGEDKVAAYANNLARELESGSHPACRMIANSIRSFGNSGQPDYVRMRQIESLFDKAPSICMGQ